MIDVITCRGTGEGQSSPDNLLTNVTKLLDPAKYRVLADVQYPASIGAFNPQGSITGVSEAQSIIAGVAGIAELVRSTPNKVGLLGYSLGAETVSTFLVMKQQGFFADCEIEFAATVANPLRAQGDCFDAAGAPGEGINGAHLPYPAGIKTLEVANADDGIACTPIDSPLRTVADGMSNFTFAGLSWGDDIIARLEQQQWQPVTWGNVLHPVITVEEYVEAAELVWGYAYSGHHTVEYLASGKLTALAGALNSL